MSTICLLLLLLMFHTVPIETSVTPYANYVVVRDYFLFFKAPEFSVYNQSEKDLYYRIESIYDIQHHVKIVTYPSKKVIAKVRSRKQDKIYEGKISIRNGTSKEWSYGTIIQHPQWLSSNFSLEWNDHRLSMINKFGSWRTEFLDRSNNELLAQFYRRWLSRNYKYELVIFSDRLPQSLYLLGLAVACRGKNG